MSSFQKKKITFKNEVIFVTLLVSLSVLLPNDRKTLIHERVVCICYIHIKDAQIQSIIKCAHASKAIRMKMQAS